MANPPNPLADLMNQHSIMFNIEGDAARCLCGFEETNDQPLTAHLFNEAALYIGRGILAGPRPALERLVGKGNVDRILGPA